MTSLSDAMKRRRQLVFFCPRFAVLEAFKDWTNLKCTISWGSLTALIATRNSKRWLRIVYDLPGAERRQCVQDGRLSNAG